MGQNQGEGDLASYLINRFVKDPCCLKKILNHHSK
jgi:hypothetical protein